MNKNDNPLISVIMPVYNEPLNELHQSIDSILNQTYQHFELILIDDNPKNETLKNYIKERASKSNKIRLLFNPHNLKLTKTENRGIRAAKGTYIARIDGDDVAYKNRLKDQLAFAIKYNLDFVFSNFSIINEQGQLTRKLTYSNVNETNQDKIKKMMARTNVAIGPLFFFKKSLFNTIHGYRNMNSEDYDFIARALIHGFRAGYQAKPLIFKRLRKAGISFSTLYDQYVIIHTISYYLTKFNYTKIMPLSVLQNRLNQINPIQRKNYENFANARYNFNDNRSIGNFLLILKTIFVSKVVFKHCLFSLTNKIKNKVIDIL